jgi:hypothetical protein
MGDGPLETCLVRPDDGRHGHGGDVRHCCRPRAALTSYELPTPTSFTGNSTGFRGYDLCYAGRCTLGAGQPESEA